MRPLRPFVLRHREPLASCTCPPSMRGVPRDDSTCYHCCQPVSESLDQLTQLRGRPIEVSWR